MEEITRTFETFVKCTHDDIEHDDYGCNECKLCGSSSSDRSSMEEIMEKFRQGYTIKQLKKYKFTFDYSEYTTPMYQYLRRMS